MKNFVKIISIVIGIVMMMAVIPVSAAESTDGANVVIAGKDLAANAVASSGEVKTDGDCLVWDAGANGATLTLDLQNKISHDYYVVLNVKTASDAPILHASAENDEDTPHGNHDLYTASEGTDHLCPGPAYFSAGKGKIILTTVGKNAASSGYVTRIESVILYYVDDNTMIQFEELEVLTNTAECYCGPQGKPISGWSGDLQMLWQTVTNDNTLELGVSVDGDGIYRLGAVFTQCVDFATIDIYLDDNLIMKGFDGYAAADQQSRYLDFGSFSLSGDDHVLKFIITGKSDVSSGYIVAADYLNVVKLLSTAPAEPTATPVPATEAPATDAPSTDAPATVAPKVTQVPGTSDSDTSGGSNAGLIIGIIAAVIVILAVVVVIVMKRKRK